MLNWEYAVTDHVAQGRTVTGGRAVIAGTEDRQHAYVALSCGTDTYMAYVFTVSPKLADPMPGPRPAPELARYDRITAERTVQQAAVATETQHALTCCPAGAARTWSWAVVESVDSGFVYFRQISAQDAARRGSLVKPLPQSA
jgi:hypothetical protein